ncbi:hypothetical protein [Bacillus toyonensis]|uniref:hypothetical protein n=1 Tax=Bacillus toyonensis TaxID=155322 RepID=UPI0036A6F03C
MERIYEDIFYVREYTYDSPEERDLHSKEMKKKGFEMIAEDHPLYTYYSKFEKAVRTLSFTEGEIVTNGSIVGFAENINNENETFELFASKGKAISLGTCSMDNFTPLIKQ